MALVDYLMGAGFDFMGTESGFSEFQKGNCSRYGGCTNTLIRSDRQHLLTPSHCYDTRPALHQHAGVDGCRHGVPGGRLWKAAWHQGSHLVWVRHVIGSME